jgi:hypothetical protein
MLGARGVQICQKHRIHLKLQTSAGDDEARTIYTENV